MKVRHCRNGEVSAVIVGVVVVLACALRASSLPILDKDLYCSNASVQVHSGRADAVEALACDSHMFTTDFLCCEPDDIDFVLGHLQHSLQFGVRNLEDRQVFLQQVASVPFASYPCAEVATAVVSTRARLLETCNTVSVELLSSMQASVPQLLCAACCASSSEETLAVAEVAISNEFTRLSQAIMAMYGELRQHDASVAGLLREAGHGECISEYLESQRRGVLTPTAHVAPLRPWDRAAKDGIYSFRDVWERWLDGVLTVVIDFAEGLQTEVQGILLAFQHKQRPTGAAHALLMHATGLDAMSAVAAKPEWEAPPVVMPVSLLPIGGEVLISLLVLMPNPSTNLRFDFANDPSSNLGAATLDDHVMSLLLLAKHVPSSRVVVITANPEQASFLHQRFDGHANVQVMWRRFALYQVDEVAALLLNSRASAHSAQRASAVYVVPPGGDAAGLSAAVSSIFKAGDIGTLQLPSQWSAGLRPVRPSDWPTRVESSGPPGGLAFRAATAGDGPCPAVVDVLESYLQWHAEVRERLRSATISGDVVSDERVLIYRCSALGFCGGHGDRLNGLLGVFILAVASKRAFFIDSPRPIPLHLLMAPRRRPNACAALMTDFLLDWRIHGAVGLTGRRVNLNDRHNDILADLPWLVSEESANVVVLHGNQRVTAEVLQSSEARAALAPSRVASRLLATPYLHADLLELLFEPSQLLAARHQQVSAVARGGRRHLLAIHFRAGNRSPDKWQDPPRHQLSELDAFLECAAIVESRLGWKDEDVSWYIATDTVDVQELPKFAELQKRGKLAFLPAGHSDAAIVHLDRSPMPLVVEGITDTWAQWLTIATSDAVVLSTSNFGVTAAESGRVRHAFLGRPGCLQTEVTAV